MRKFVSLGAAMMMGAVLGRENHLTAFSSGRATTINGWPTHLDRPVKLHPRHDSVGEVDIERKSIISSPRDVQASRDTFISRTRRNVKNRSRSQRKESPGPSSNPDSELSETPSRPPLLNLTRRVCLCKVIQINRKARK